MESDPMIAKPAKAIRPERVTWNWDMRVLLKDKWFSVFPPGIFL